MSANKSTASADPPPEAEAVLASNGHSVEQTPQQPSAKTVGTSSSQQSGRPQPPAPPYAMDSDPRLFMFSGGNTASGVQGTSNGDASQTSIPTSDNDMYEDHVSFIRTVNAFHHYKQQAIATLESRQRNFAKLQSQHDQLLCVNLNGMFEQYLESINTNSEFFECISQASAELFRSYWPMGSRVRPEDVPPPTPLDLDKVFCTLRQFVRDWSVDGRCERDSVYTPILTTLEEQFPDRDMRGDVRVLIPGAGLCRLSVELALRGFAAQANEFSYHMLIAAHYVQNHIVSSGQHKICPYCDNTCNLVNRADQFLDVLIPDLCASEALDRLGEEGLAFGDLSMVAGDFTEVYSKPAQHQQWEAVATCFFIDTAHNIVEYLEIIYNLLVPGGVWVNVGPLLYHFADSPEDVSIELSLGEVLRVAQHIGFHVRKEPTFIDTTYTNNQRSMKQLVYRCAFFVLERPLVPTNVMPVATPQEK